MRNYLQDIVRSIMSSVAATEALTAFRDGGSSDLPTRNPNFYARRSGGSAAKRRAKWRARTGQK